MLLTRVLVSTDSQGLLFLQNHPKKLSRNLCMMVNGNMEKSRRPFES